MRGALILVCVLGCNQEKPTFVGSTVLRDTSDATGPYGVTTVIHAESAVKRVDVVWDRDDGHFSTVGLSRIEGDERNGAWSGSIPGLGGAGKVRYFFVARTQDGPPASDPGAVNQQQAYYSFRVLPMEAPPDAGDIPTRTCAHDEDCFTNERCDPEILQCVPR